MILNIGQWKSKLRQVDDSQGGAKRKDKGEPSEVSNFKKILV